MRRLFLPLRLVAETDQPIAIFLFMLYMRKTVICDFFSYASLKFDEEGVDSIELDEFYQNLLLV